MDIYPTANVGSAVLVADLGPSSMPNEITNIASTVWYTENGENSIYRVDLTNGQRTTAVSTGAYDPWEIGTDGTWVVWSGFKAEGRSRSSWNVQALAVDTNKVFTVDTQMSAWTGPLSDVGVHLGVGTGVVAYGFGAPTPIDPEASQIMVRDLATGTLIRTISTQEVLYDIAVYGGTVAYTECHVDTANNNAVYDTRLMVSTAEEPEPREVGKHSFGISLDDERLFWNSKPDEQGAVGNEGGVVVQTTLPGAAQEVISSIDSTTGAAVADTPSASDGDVVWNEMFDAAGHVVFRPSGSTQPYELAHSDVHTFPHTDGKWIVWYTLADLTPGITSEGLFGIDISKIAL